MGSNERRWGYLANLSLLNRLLLAESLVFMFMIVMTVLAAQWFSEGLRDSIREERAHTTLSFAGGVDQVLAEGFLTLETIRGDSIIRRDVARQLAAESDLLTRGIFLVDSNGRIVESFTMGTSLDGANIQGLLETADTGTAGRLGWGFKPRPQEQAVVALAIPTSGIAGGGYILGLADVFDSTLGEIAREAKRIGSTGHADVVDSRTTTMVSTELDHLLHRSDHPTFYAESLASGAVGVVRTVVEEEEPNPDDEPNQHLMGFAQLNTLPWGVALGGDVQESFASINRLWKTIVVLLVVGGTISVGATIFGTSRLVAPVRGLSDAAHEVASGSLSKPIIPTTGGEIGDLAISIETMRRSLHSWGVELDRRVEERTEELARRSADLAASAAVARATASTVDLGKMIETVATEIEEHLDVDGAVISVFETRNVPEISHGGASVPVALPGQARRCRLCSLDGGFPTGKWVELSEFEEPPACLGVGFQAVFNAPIQNQGQQIGTLCLLRKQIGERTADERPALDQEIVALLSAQLAIGIENASLYQGLRWREEQRRQLLAKVLTAQEEERRRIARELHDDTGQAFIALILGLDAIITQGADDPDFVLSRTAHLRVFSEQSLENLRGTVMALRPSALDDLGLTAAVQRYADYVVRDAAISVELASNLTKERMPAELETVVFRVIQEALNNVVRHSGATSVAIKIDLHPDVLEATVSDNGRGFSVQPSDDPLAGVGLEGMRERANLVGGYLVVESRPDQGSVVRLEVPLDGWS